MTVLVLCAGLLQAGALPAAAASGKRPTPQQTKPVPVERLRSHYPRPKKMPAFHPGKVSWPSGSATASADRSTPVRAGSLPVWLGPATHRTRTRNATAGQQAPTSVDVRVESRAAAKAAGVDGVVLSLSRTKDATRKADAGLTVDTSAFADAFGADWASRLHLVSLPACALTTPTKAACRTQTPVASSDDAKAHKLTGDVTLAAATAVPAKTVGGATAAKGTAAKPNATAARATTLIAAVSAPAGGGGDFSATSLNPSSQWQAGGSSDAFTWAYPVSVPNVPGGLKPTVSLGYNSQSQDGLTSSTNNQASVIGDGFDYSPGFIERSYQSCDQNPAGTTKTNDNCWSDENTLTMSLGGSASPLVKDDTTGDWHPQNDAGERVQLKTGAPNGDNDGEYWVVTTDDGTQYYFGLDQLPGYASGDTATDSVWTEPVYATASGQPCYNATFADSWCQQAYRWNLDYVVDTHKDALSYWYAKDTAYYARDKGTTANTPYTRDGYLTKITYGQRDGSVYSTSPAAQVLFTVKGRCNTSTTGCDTSTLSTSTASNWPDVPYDLYCAQNATCSVTSPTFWSEEELTGIQTQVLEGTTETNVDSFALTHTFPATGDATTPALWLSSITRTGQDTGGGGPITPVSMPPLTLTGTPLSNRVDVTDGYPPITRQRLNTITTETGETIDVAYASAACGSATPSDDSTNAKLCYPAYWVPTGQTDPVKDYFNKYIVTGVTQQDPTLKDADGKPLGINDTIATHYTPVGTPAWHYDDNSLTPAKQRTWNQFRGFAGMKVTVGTAPDPVTETDYTYFRGMDGDTLPSGGTRSATVTDSRGDPAVKDLNQYAGMPYETVQYDGSGSGKVVGDTVTAPWTSTAQATQKLGGGLPDSQAFLTGQSEERVYTPLADGSTRETETDYTHDDRGRITKTDDLGDVSTADDDQCATVTYDDNTGAWIFDKPDENVTVSVDCDKTPTVPDDVVSDTRTFYDGSATFGAAPSAGDVTMTQNASSYTGSTPTFATMSMVTKVDAYGRALSTTDADNRTTTTAYTPATGAEPTQVKTTDPMSLATTTGFDPARGLTLQTTDPAGYVTKHQYDALGRTTADFKPGITSAYDKYSYSISNSAPSVVTTQTLDDDQSYRSSETIYDAMLRQFETQSATMDGGVDVTDTVYNTDGLKAKVTDPYYAKLALSPTPVLAQDGDVPSETGYLYDGAGRQTAAVSYKLGTETWRTTTGYGGDVTTTVPPKGATAESVFTDARGNTSDLRQYHTGVTPDPTDTDTSDYSDTTYHYDPSGNRTGEKDAAGNSWSWTYDLLGNQVKATDPDTGTTDSTYDNAGQLLTVTDARGKQTTYQYDLDGRKKATYDTTGGAAPAAGNQTAAWTYDTLKKGLPTASTSYQKGTTSPSVTDTVLSYNTLGLPGTQRETLANLPANEAALAPSAGYVTTTGYTAVAGLEASRSYPAIGSLAGENVTYGYDKYGEPTSAAGAYGTGNNWTYVQAVGYDELGKPLQYTMGGGANSVYDTLGYDQQTQRLTDTKTTDLASSTVIDDTGYSYGSSDPATGGVSAGAGLVTSATDKKNGGATTDTQCYTYDYATRLAQAWTATDQCAKSPSAGDSSTVGGPQPYWQSWTYDAAGDRKTQTDHDTAGNTADDTITTYDYPAQGSDSDQPHTLTKTTATGPGATARTESLTYDDSGNEATVTSQAGTQTMSWDDQGNLASVSDTATGGTTSYLYDTDGNLVLRTDPGQATLFVDGDQIVENTSTQAISGTRYITLDGTTVAEHSSNGDIQYLIPDRQGTDTLAVDYLTYAVTRRAYLPFGQDRGTPPTTWPGDDGYIGGTPDTSTGLENLGAREYDPGTGRFISADPVLETTSPTQLGGYDYSGNDPVTNSDPTGQMLVDPQFGSFGNAHVLQDWMHDEGYTDSHGKSTQKYQNYLSDYNRDWDAYYYQATHPQPKPKKKSLLGNFVDYTKKVADVAYDYSGAKDVVGCMTGPTLSGCVKAATLVVGFVATGGEDEFEVAALEAAEDDGASAAARVGEACEKAGEVPHSFIGSTPVLKSDGRSEPIKDIKVGDQVEATDPQTGTTASHTVERVIKTTTDRDFTNLTIRPTKPGKNQAGAHSATLTTTWHHPFWNATTGQWVEASHLTRGTHLRQPDGTYATVTNVRNYHSTAVTYDLTIAGLHTYYVLAGGVPILVHNSDGDTGPGCGVQLPLFVLHDGDVASPAQMAASKGGPTAGKNVTSRIRNRMISEARQDGDGTLQCWRCGMTTDNPANVQIGHVNVPRNLGGNLERENLCIEGAACNSSAQDRGAPSVGMSCAERGGCGAGYGRFD
ncbi:polymorphic toxin-type HINT domain-containing protein [Streptomyces murinus]|uniref:polymorphic toxin-type HINT domain-containing protein n=1 Tax=Streptomyces murinus TaxID=33900 RepID=UPI00380D6C5E